MKFDNSNLTEGYIARHTPTGCGAPGREAAIIDIAQDFLLSHLEECGKMEHVCLKGGTAIRKLYAGKEGRFSLDLDFSIDDMYIDSEERELDFVSINQFKSYKSLAVLVRFRRAIFSAIFSSKRTV